MMSALNYEITYYVMSSIILLFSYILSKRVMHLIGPNLPVGAKPPWMKLDWVR